MGWRGKRARSRSATGGQSGRGRPGARGYVYVLSNPSMPGIVKIGHSRDPASRAAQLSAGTGVPTPFRIVCSVAVPDAAGLEAKVHRRLVARRVARSREFFRLEPREAKAEVKRLATKHKDALRRRRIGAAAMFWAGLVFKAGVGAALLAILLDGR